MGLAGGKIGILDLARLGVSLALGAFDTGEKISSFAALGLGFFKCACQRATLFDQSPGFAVEFFQRLHQIGPPAGKGFSVACGGISATLPGFNGAGGRLTATGMVRQFAAQLVERGHRFIAGAAGESFGVAGLGELGFKLSQYVG